MRVGILTWRRGSNYGTNLQSFALHYFLNKELNIDAELIDYIRVGDYLEPKSLRYIFDGFFDRVRVRIDRYIKNKKIKYYNQLYREGYTKKEKNIDSFCRMIKFSHPVSTQKQLQDLNNIYDAFICGSDQIWNPTQIDRRYYLNFAHRGKRIISYAPSMGTKSLPRYMHNKYRELLSNFTAISTRESLSAINLSEVLGRRVEHTLDPVFLLNLGDWIELAKYSENSRGEYLLCYFISDNKRCYRDAERYAKEHHLKIVSLVVGSAGGYEIEGATIDVDSGPQEFLGLIERARCIMTNSFHCTAFSIIYQKEFYVYGANMRSKMANIDFRTIDLLSFFDLGDRFIDGELYDKLTTIMPIDYLSVQSILDERREFCINFLKKALFDEK